MSSEGAEELTIASESAPVPLTPTAPPPPSPVPAREPPPCAPVEQPAEQAVPPTATMTSVVNNLPTIFGEVFERNVTFCVDTSGSMFSCLHVVKEQLIETLFKHAQREGDTTFNIIEFNSVVTQWADKMVSCTPETVQVAAGWIKDLEAKTGTNTMDALLTALQDNACQAVYLVTDGLPDTFAEDILDTVIDAANGRPIHCIYLAKEKAETAAVEFLEDLAVESFGSLHIATLTLHGCVERITPVYRSEHACGRVIRTVNNTLRPNFKTCSVATTLQVDPDEVLNPPPRAAPLGFLHPPPFVPPWWGWRYWGLGMYPYRYLFPSTWSRYRPAKSWLRAQDKLVDIPDGMGLSPSAGALLIGKQVLARRIADGYFYMGSVQSQILDDKFLVAFGPCKHGKFRETTYQDTFVFDIVDYNDAQRHTIITGDHVLAPWEPEGERYGPGIVINGQEKRQAVGYKKEGPEDHELTVAFSNGHTEKVALHKAIWVPQPVYERVSLELKMPRDTRSSIMTTNHYPHHSLPGYPTSGPQATPPEFYTPENISLEPTTYYSGWGPIVYPPYAGGYPPYPVVIRQKQEQHNKDHNVEDDNAVIPGTDMTRKELDERISSQISEHKLVEGQQTQTSSRLLKKREKLDENSLKKSVTFSTSDLVQTAPEESLVTTVSDPRTDADSGFASSPELDIDSATKEQLDAIDEERRRIAMERRWLEQEKRWLEEEEQRINEAKNDPRLQFYRSPGIGRRPAWKYWRSDPCPPLPGPKSGGGSGGGGGGRSSSGAFRETALQAPLEARDQKRSVVTGSVEWTSPGFKYVDVFAKHDHSSSVEECLKTPHPPPAGSYRIPDVQPPTEEDKAEAKRAYRRKRFAQRQMAWQERLENEDRMKALMEDNHRERIQAQIAREQERQQQEQEMINKAREAKKRISRELRERIEEKQKQEKEREEKRIDAMKQRRERREAIEAQRQKEIEEGQKRSEEIRRQQSLARHNAVTERLNEEEAKNNAIANQHRNAKLNRLNHFHTLEDQAQAKKDLRVAVSDQHLALYRSQIFP